MAKTTTLLVLYERPPEGGSKEKGIAWCQQAASKGSSYSQTEPAVHHRCFNEQEAKALVRILHLPHTYPIHKQSAIGELPRLFHK